MNARESGPAQIRRAGLIALSQALGAVGTVRFLQQFDNGSGDYSASRDELLGNPSLDDIVDEILLQRAPTGESSDDL